MRFRRSENEPIVAMKMVVILGMKIVVMVTRIEETRVRWRWRWRCFKVGFDGNVLGFVFFFLVIVVLQVIGGGSEGDLRDGVATEMEGVFIPGATQHVPGILEVKPIEVETVSQGVGGGADGGLGEEKD
ncbi:hypothetical protein NE237_033091 [Protea cynaroides]|uniref:Transmembrane protein n=1 Tax=Protea cynaroides TaxID=273540 RepID=A0A9Q0L5T5_9MAGN|nr:hypothetical protein NE237_033091 [Protea cynaroides]